MYLTQGFVFRKKFGDYWDSEVYIFTPGNEIGLINQFWPNPAHYVKLASNREMDALLSMRHDVSKKKNCLPDSTFLEFTKCFKSKLRNIFLSNISLDFCPECRNSNTSICATVQMKFFLEPGRELKFCSTQPGLTCSTDCYSKTIRLPN